MEEDFKSKYAIFTQKSKELSELDALVGTYTCTTTYVTPIGEITHKGASKLKWELNSLFISGKFVSYDDDGKITFKGKEKIGYDLRKKKYFVVWMDSFASMFLHSYGDYHSDSKEFLFEGTHDNVMDDVVDQPFRYKYSITDTGYLMEMFHLKDGEFHNVLRVNAVRNPTKERLSLYKEEEEKSESKITNVHFITLLVNNIEEALRFYVDKLKFVKVKDIPYGEVRWIVIRAPQQSNLEIVVQEAKSEEEKKAVGKQAGDSVFLVFNSNDIQFDYDRLKDDVKFKHEPKDEFWGIQAPFFDPFGNLIDLVQPKPH